MFGLLPLALLVVAFLSLFFGIAEGVDAGAETLVDLQVEMKALRRQMDNATADEEKFAALDAEYKSVAARAEALLAEKAKVNSRRQRIAEIDSQMPAAQPSELDESAAALTSGLRERGQDDPSGGFASLGDLAVAVYGAAKPSGAVDERLHILAGPGGVSQGVGSGLGFLVPTVMNAAIWDRLRQSESSLLRLTDQYTLTVGESIEFLAVNETTRVDGSRFGGAKAYWGSEAEQMTKTQPKVRKIRLEPHELHAYTQATNKLLRNAPALDAFLNRAMAMAIEAKINAALVSGTGAGQPKGVLKSGALITVPKESGQAAATLVPENIVKMYARRLGTPTWFMNQTVETQLLLMTLQRGTSMWPMYMPPGALASSPNGAVLGRSMETSEHMKALGSLGDIMMIDWQAYAVATKGTVDTAMSMHFLFDTNQTAFRTIVEIDGQPWIDSAVTPENGDTRSPFIALAARP